MTEWIELGFNVIVVAGCVFSFLVTIYWGLERSFDDHFGDLRDPDSDHTTQGDTKQGGG